MLTLQDGPGSEFGLWSSGLHSSHLPEAFVPLRMYLLNSWQKKSFQETVSCQISQAGP